MRTIYLDYCSTTPIAASVRESMLPFLSEFFGHPASSHWHGRAAQEAIEDSRSNVASLIGCHPSEVVFTSGGTESVNLALLGVANAIAKSFENGARPHLITSDLEHTCVRSCAEHLARKGWDVTFVGSDEDGMLKVDEFEKAITPQTRIVSIIHANHRIGTIQPIEQVAEICQQKDILLHTDASQSAGKIDAQVDHLGVDMLSLSGHKFYAPKGIGALYVRTGVPIDPILFGEGCEAGLRPGTANVPHIVGLGSAAKMVTAGLESTQAVPEEKRNSFHAKLEKALGQTLLVHGLDSPRLPNILSFELPGVSTEAMQQMLPEICFGSPTTNGHSNGRVANTTHAAIGLDHGRSEQTMRVSFGWTTTEDEVENAVAMIASAYDSLRQQ